VSHENKFCCSPDSGCCKCRVAVYSVVILGTFLIAGALVWAMIHYTKPAPLAEDRNATRRKAHAEVIAAGTEALNNYGWVDQNKGIVRLPIEQAMKLTVAEWENPAAGRATLLERQAKASAVPPKAPEKPSAFE
jgi:hypothetical protein